MFDIDKLNIYWPEYKKPKAADLVKLSEKYDEVINNGSYEGSFENFLYDQGIFDLKLDSKSEFNKLLELEKKILLHPENAHHLFMPVVDDIIADAKDGAYGKVYVELLGNSAEDSKKILQSLMPHVNVEKSIIFVKGKFGVGIVALDITFQSLSQNDSLRINDIYYDLSETDDNGDPTPKSSVLLFDGLQQNKTLGNYVDSDGNILTEVLSQLLTSQVDNVKNPVAVKLGINTQTLNAVGYLIKRGVGFDTIIKFIKQPMIQEYLEMQRINESMINKTNGKELTKDALIEKLLTQNGAKDLPNVYGTDFIITEKILENNLTNPDQSEQLLMFSYFLELQSQSKALSYYMRDQSADTKGLKDLAGWAEMILNFEQMIQSDFIEDAMSKRSTGVLSEFIKSRNLYNHLYRDFYLSNELPDSFGNVRNLFMKLQKTQNKKEKVYNTFINDFMLFLVRKYSIDPSEYDRLFGFTDELSVPNRILKLKDLNPDNLLIRAFHPMLSTAKDFYADKSVDSLRLFERDLTSLDVNDLIQSAKEIYDIDPKLYEDLVKFIFMQTGLNNSPFNYFKVIPMGDITKRTEANDFEFIAYDFLKNAVDQFVRETEDSKLEITSSYINHFQMNNPSFLRRTKSKDKKPFKKYPFKYALYYQQGEQKLVDTETKSIVNPAGGTYFKRYNIENPGPITMDMVDSKYPSKFYSLEFKKQGTSLEVELNSKKGRILLVFNRGGKMDLFDVYNPETDTYTQSEPIPKEVIEETGKKYLSSSFFDKMVEWSNVSKNYKPELQLESEKSLQEQIERLAKVDLWNDIEKEDSEQYWPKEASQDKFSQSEQKEAKEIKDNCKYGK